ncbi:MAG: Tuberous sclerosis 2-like protein [Thelocarpon superellum]|nr:MAG: Tuberous sclerosis 2-like protein [Thelocarpon superellum]
MGGSASTDRSAGSHRMSPSPANDEAQTADPKASSGIAGVLKHLTRGTRAPAAVSSPNIALAPTANLLLGRTLSKAAVSAAGPYGAVPANLDVDQHYEQIRPGQPLPQRIAAAEALRHVVEDISLTSIMGIWAEAQDLTAADLPAEARRAGFDLLTACVKHSHPTPLERRQFFKTLSVPCNPDDFHLQLNAMVELTNGGKDINAFEGVMMPLLTKWLAEWFRASAAARKKEKDKGSTKSGGGVQGEETNLHELFSFVNDVIRFSFNAFQEHEILALLDQILAICKKTTAGSDIKNSIGIIHGLITYGDIPRAQLEPCLEVLCGTFSTVKELADPTWSAISNLCRSHVAQNTLTSLLNIIRAPALQAGANTNTVRGAAIIADKIMRANGADGLPLVSFSLLLDAFQKALAADSARLEVDLLDALLSHLEDEELRAQALQEDDWSVLLDIIAQCARRAVKLVDVRMVEASLQSSASTASSRAVRDRDWATKLSLNLFRIIEQLQTMCLGEPDLVQKGPIMSFFMTVHEHIPDSTAQLVVTHYMDENLCYPSHPDWVQHKDQLLDNFFKDAKRPASVRVPVILAIRGVFEVITDMLPPDTVTAFVAPLMETMRHERDGEVIEPLVAFAADVARQVGPKLCDLIIEHLRHCALPRDAPATPLASPSSRTGSSSSRPSSSSVSSAAVPTPPPVLLATMATRALVTIFIHAVTRDAAKASKTFDAILDVAQAKLGHTEARLCALKLLVRLRSDWAHGILIVQATQSETIAASLYRTVDSLAMKQAADESGPHRHGRADEPTSARSSRGTSLGQSVSALSRSTTRTVSGAARSLRATAPLWLYPDPAPLPVEPSTAASQLLYSCTNAIPFSPTAAAAEERMALKINVWLELVISIIQQGGDWEVYSYVLVHLGAQLSNHSLFAGAVPQIKLLRNVLCEQMKTTNFHEPPASSGLKKADMTICIFHILTMLVSYHEHFSKNEQDEMVRTFMLGVGSWERTATCCVHALGVCCYELPLSLSKSLNTILQRMSQIITQSHVAVHVLEFLGGLARMPEVYVNFREDEYRRVFGICFRYLQYVRDQRGHSAASGAIGGGGGGSGPQSARTSYASTRPSTVSRDFSPAMETPPPPPVTPDSSADDLPQYVYALAYHVITFWFMSLKLVDRSRYISWITRNLVAVEPNGRENIDEQSLVTIDMMQRVTYSDFDETLPDAHFASAADGAISKKSWVLGLSLLTVETAVATGASQLTKRQASATTHATYRSTLAPRPLHQIPLSSHTMTDAQDEASRVAVLPNHIMLQLMSSSTRTVEATRPIPLPHDDSTNRALAALDRIPTVDGHKVGIIYIGAGQTKEAAILANFIGSSDYTAFLEGVGTLVRLKGAQFNTQGLDREYDTDGEFAICWRDRVTEMVFHVATMMPTNKEHDPHCTNKKRHTGNDFVNIIFNDSGLPFRFDTFPSDFNYVNIVITPESRASFVGTRMRDHEVQKQFYKVQVMSRPGFPEISAAAESKIVSGQSLPAFVRLLALNASVFSLVWANREGGEHVSSWRNRLREIVKLRDKHAGSPTASSVATTPTGPPSSAGTGASVSGLGMAGPLLGSRLDHSIAQRDSLSARRASAATFFSEGLGSHRSSILSTAATATTETDSQDKGDVESLADGFDFSKWA